MARKRFTTEQTIHRLGEAEVAIATGTTIPETSKLIGVTEQTCSRWQRAAVSHALSERWIPARVPRLEG